MLYIKSNTCLPSPLFLSLDAYSKLFDVLSKVNWHREISRRFNDRECDCNFQICVKTIKNNCMSISSLITLSKILEKCVKIQVIIIMYIQVNNIIDDYQISFRRGGRVSGVWGLRAVGAGVF